MTATTTERKTIAQLLAEQAENLIPVEGDRAFTLYNGVVYEGILTEIKCDMQKGLGGGWAIIPADGKEEFANRYGDYRFYRHLPTANVSVYTPDERSLETEEYEKYDREQFNMSADSTKRVRFDTKRVMFYVSAHEN